MASRQDLSSLANEIGTANAPTMAREDIKPVLQSLSKGTIVLDPSLITMEFDLLRFGAGALNQLKVAERTNDEPESATTSTLLISSPYNNPGHYLDLLDLDTSDLVFAKALTALKAVRADYATASYTQALNFGTVLEYVRKLAADEDFEWKERTFYVVIFRSKLKETIDSNLLYKLDFESHGEACESGGLLKYWFGSPNSERRNLATCFWRSREDAHKGGLGPWHKKARVAGRELYDSIVFSTHRFTILDGAFDFKFEDWE